MSLKSNLSQIEVGEVPAVTFHSCYWTHAVIRAFLRSSPLRKAPHLNAITLFGSVLVL
jgi:hypothetical protein